MLPFLVDEFVRLCVENVVERILVVSRLERFSLDTLELQCNTYMYYMMALILLIPFRIECRVKGICNRINAHLSIYMYILPNVYKRLTFVGLRLPFTFLDQCITSYKIK